jgi:hypothetical protein
MTGVPQISVCMAAYNAGPFIGQAIESLLVQTFREFELIVVDDGSTDQTPDLIRQYAHTDARVRALRNEANRGLVFTRNRSVAACSAPLVAIADADDVFHPRRLERQWHYLAQHPDIGVLSSAVGLMDGDGRKTGEYRFYSEDRHIRFFLLLGPCVWNTTSVYRRELLGNEPYRPRFDGGAEDYDLWARLRNKTRFAALDEVLATVRVHGASCTANSAATQRNIFEIGSALLSDYLQQPVDSHSAAALARLLLRTGMDAESARCALELGSALWTRSVELEASDTVQLLRRKLFAAFWVQAQYHVYAARPVSRAMARFALRLQPSLSVRPCFASYACRSLTPDLARLRLKRALGGLRTTDHGPR